MTTSPFALNDGLRPDPRQFPIDMVIGHVRWHKALGLPEIDLASVFNLSCFHWENQPTGEGRKSVVFRSPHPVDIWAGPHDNTYFRISFITTSQVPHQSGPDANLYKHNFLEASFHPNVKWATIGGRKAIVPANVRFDLPAHVQVLPELEVVFAGGP